MALLLPACATNLPLRTADTSAPERWRHTIAGATESGAQGGGLQLQTWWRLFDETQLNDLIARVSAANLQIREMAARIAAASALEQAATTEFRPSLRLATEPAETPDSRAGYWQAGVELEWPLGLFGRSAAVASAARAQAELARSDAEGLANEIVAQTTRSYMELRNAKASASNLDARIAAQTERVALMRERVRLRLSTPADLATEQVSVDELRSERLTADRMMTESSERLGLLTGIPEAYVISTTDPPVAPLTSPRVQSIPADLLRNRADVRHAEEEAINAVAQLNIARADLYPQLTLTGSLMLGLPIAGTARGPTQALAALAPAIDIPLFDWGRRRLIVTARDRALEGTLLAYRASILAALHQVEAALGAYDSLTRDSELRRAAVTRAEQREQSTRTSVRLGRASRLDVLDTMLNRLLATASLAQSEHARALAFISLCEALGGARWPAPT